jgi:2-oxoglutarate dehydrogenase complex dihydrolipoamide succinyltransferase (E2) component
MRVDMVMPQMGESITEATISKWLKKPGESVQKDEIILEISTDKVDSEIPAPASGTIAELLYNEGDVVAVKERIAVIDTAAGATQAQPTPKGPSTKSVEPPEVAPAAPAPSAPADQSGSDSSSRFYSPLVRSLAEKHGVPLKELDALEGSGQAGRVTKEDFMQHLERRAAPAPAAAAPRIETPRASSSPSPSSAKGAPMPDLGAWGDDGTKVIPMDNMRQAIADHMVRSKQTSPHVYSVQEIDVTNISKWRAKHKDAFTKSEGFSLSFTPFFLEAAVRALVKYPYVNASVQDKKIVLKRNVNLGCAVALENMGLIVPVIKRAEEKNFVGLARSLNDLAARARNKKLLPDDVAGGTFTVTNPGVFGTIIGNPIINQPQVAILCLGAIKKRPVVIDDMIAIRDICYVTLSYDHRIIDGSLGGQFLAYIREYLEGWDLQRSL